MFCMNAKVKRHPAKVSLVSVWVAEKSIPPDPAQNEPGEDAKMSYQTDMAKIYRDTQLIQLAREEFEREMRKLDTVFNPQFATKSSTEAYPQGDDGPKEGSDAK